MVFVDSDVMVRPESLALLLRALEDSPAAFATYDPEPLNKNFATLLYHTLSCRSLEDTSEKTSVFYSYCAAISKDLFLELGGFDTSFTRATFEDVELGHQLARRGLHTKHSLSGAYGCFMGYGTTFPSSPEHTSVRATTLPSCSFRMARSRSAIKDGLLGKTGRSWQLHGAL